MSKFITTVFFLAVGVALLGYCLNWFIVKSHRDIEMDKVNINLTVDTHKVKADAEKVKEKTTEFAHKVTGETQSTTQPPPPAEKPSP